MPSQNCSLREIYNSDEAELNFNIQLNQSLAAKEECHALGLKVSKNHVIMKTYRNAAGAQIIAYGNWQIKKGQELLKFLL